MLPSIVHNLEVSSSLGMAVANATVCLVGSDWNVKIAEWIKWNGSSNELRRAWIKDLDRPHS